jgi:acylglycerol lipase
MWGIGPLASGLLVGAGGALAYQVRTRPMDSAENRRAAARVLPTVKVPPGIKIERKDFVTSKNVRLSYLEFYPEVPSKAVVYVCHGFVDSTNWLWYARCVRFAEEGFTCIAVDLEGHGLSDGLLAYIPSFENMVTGAYEVFEKRKEEVFKNQKSFLVGESMGGAVALWMLLLFGQEKSKWDGAIFFAPMCKIAEDMIPPKPVVIVLEALAGLIPTWQVVPSPNVVDKAFRDPAYAKLVKEGPYYVDHPPRIATAVQLLYATQFIDKKMDDITIPFLLLHGAEDTVTDPKTSQELFDRSKSSDKTFKLYPKMWHALFEDPDRENAWKDIVSWLNDRL